MVNESTDGTKGLSCRAYKGELLKETEYMICDSSFYHFITVACQLCEATQNLLM